MKTLKMLLFVIVLVVGSASAFAQSVDELGGANPPVTSTDPVGQDPTNLPSHQPPPWETREGVEVAARNYFEAKNQYNECRHRGDKPGMARAAKRMRTHSNALAAFKKQQAARDKAQDARLDAHSNLVWKHESQLNGKGGLNDRQGKTEKRVKTLEEEMDAVTPAIAGINGRFDGLTWWVLILTLIVMIGFGRRYWIHR